METTTWRYLPRRRPSVPIPRSQPPAQVQDAVKRRSLPGAASPSGLRGRPSSRSPRRRVLPLRRDLRNAPPPRLPRRSVHRRKRLPRLLRRSERPLRNGPRSAAALRPARRSAPARRRRVRPIRHAVLRRVRPRKKRRRCWPSRRRIRAATFPPACRWPVALRVPRAFGRPSRTVRPFAVSCSVSSRWNVPASPARVSGRLRRVPRRPPALRRDGRNGSRFATRRRPGRC